MSESKDMKDIRKEFDKVLEDNRELAGGYEFSDRYNFDEVFKWFEQKLLEERKKTLEEVNNLKVTLSEQYGEPYIVIDDMKQGGETIFAGRLESIQINNLTKEVK